jgi:glycosyltransferase involved in cell wall biosynthesis
MQVHQVLAGASSADAVTDVSLALQAELRRLGPSEIFALHIDPSLAGRVRPLDEYDDYVEHGGAGLIVLHAAVGAEPLSAFLTGRPEPVALVYHDGTADDSLMPYDPTLAACLQSRCQELAGLAPRVALAIADSEFSATQLQELGYREVVVSPLPIDVNALRHVPPDPRTAAYLDCLDGPKFLFVGELLPHRRLDWLLAAYHTLVTYLEPRAHLLLVGDDPVTPYRQALDSYVAELRLDGAHISGPVSQASLAAYYRSADVFVTASEKEGCCAPLLEAMAFDVPVLARAYGAILETLAEAGILLAPDDGPLVAAEVMATLASDDGPRSALVTRGRRRLGEVDPRAAGSALVTRLEALVT